jgi:hypothetical protein
VAREEGQDIGGYSVALIRCETEADGRAPGQVETYPEAEPIGYFG